MFKIILIFFVVFYFFSAYARRFSNPYKLTYIFGLKGAGKSTYMIKLMKRDMKHGWTVYTNMDDVRIPGVRLFESADLKECTPDQRSALYIDEAGLLWDNRDFKSFDKGFTSFFKLQRKYKCKVVINSQSFDVDKKIRDLVDRMYLITNVANVVGIARPILRNIKLIEAQGQYEARIADSLRFDKIWHFKFFWLPAYHKYFNSFKAPERPPLPFQPLADTLDPSEAKTPRIPVKMLLKRIQSNFRKRK